MNTLLIILEHIKYLSVDLITKDSYMQRLGHLIYFIIQADTFCFESQE